MATNAANDSGNSLSQNLSAPFIPASHIPFPSPLNVTNGNIVENLKFFKLKWYNYLVATGTQALPETVKKSLLFTALGEDCLKLYQNFVIKPEDCETADSIWITVERNLTPVINLRRQRAMFNMAIQRENEPYDVYFTRLRKLIADCGYGENEDEILLDKIIYSINDSCFRKTLWMDRDITLTQAIERCKSKEYVDLQNTGIEQNQQKQTGVGYQQHQQPPGVGYQQHQQPPGVGYQQQQQQQQHQQHPGVRYQQQQQPHGVGYQQQQQQQQQHQQQRNKNNKKQADRTRNWQNNRQWYRERIDSTGSAQNRRQGSSISSQQQQNTNDRPNPEPNKNLSQDQQKQDDGAQGPNAPMANMPKQQQNVTPIKRQPTMPSPQEFEISDLPEIPTDLRIPPPPYEEFAREFARISPLVLTPQELAASKPMEAPRRVEHPLMQSTSNVRHEVQKPIEHKPLPSVIPQQNRYQQHDQPTTTSRQPMQSAPRAATPETASIPRAGPSRIATQTISRCQSCGQNQSSLLEHSNNRSLCPASRYVCKKCGLQGHYEVCCTREKKPTKDNNCVIQ